MLIYVDLFVRIGCDEIMSVVESYLSESLSGNPKDLLQLRQLSEATKNKLSTKSIQVLLKFIVQKCEKIDFTMIDDSKGDVTKCKFYSNMKECLKILSTKNKSDSNLTTVSTALSNIESYKSEFISAYKMNNEVLTLLYNSIVMSIVNSVTYLISIDVSGDSAKLRNSVRSTIPQLASFNKLCSSGKQKQVFKKMLVRENYELFLENVTDTGDGVELSGDFGVFGLIPMLLVSIIPIIQNIIYFFYRFKTKMSDHSNMQADYLESHHDEFKSNNNKADVKKREDEIKRLRQDADDYIKDLKVSTRETEREIKKDNDSVKKIQSEVVNNPPAPTIVNTSNDDDDDIF